MLLLIDVANDFKLILLTDNCCKLAVTKELVATCWGCWVVATATCDNNGVDAEVAVPVAAVGGVTELL